MSSLFIILFFCTFSFSFFILLGGAVDDVGVLFVFRGEPFGEYRSVVLALANEYTFRVVWGVLPAFLLIPFSHSDGLLLLFGRGDPELLDGPLPPPLLLFL